MATGNSVESQFTLHLRDECADAELTLDSDIASFNYVMGATTESRTPDFTNSKTGTCTETITWEYYDSSSLSWIAATVGTPSFVTTASTNFDIYLDGVDAASVAIRPEQKTDIRVTVSLPDSIQTADKTTIQDSFTVTIQDECKDD